MAYQVIARKYRPQRFSEVVGQEHVARTLSQAIEQKRIAHAYLFCGPRGTGKTTIARIFSKCLNCTGGPKVDFDEDDPRCKEIAEGRSLDVLEIDGASNNGVEQVRELRETCRYTPANSRFKIYIIDEVHMLSTAAFNALLKTLEEPPEHVKFMFATTDPEKVLPTILSRCQRFDLRRIPVKLIAEHLAYIAKKEKVEIDAAALHAIARGAEGAMRDAESALDQLISFCGEKIEEADVLSMYGLTAQSQIFELSAALLAGEIENALRLLNDLAQNGKDLGHLLSDLLNHFRNLLIYQVSRGDLKLLEVGEAEAATLKEQSKQATAEGLTRIMEVLTETEMRLRDAASKKILIEVALLRAIEARNATSIDTLLKQLQKLRDSGGCDEDVPSVSVPGQPAPAKPKPATRHALEADPGPQSSNLPQSKAAVSPLALTAEPQTVDGQGLDPTATPAEGPGEGQSSVGDTQPADANLTAVWSRLLEAVGRSSPFTRTYLLEAHPVSFQKNLFTIGFDPEFADHLSLVDNSRNHGLLQTRLGELGFPNLQIKFIKAERPVPYISEAVPSQTGVELVAAATAAPAPAVVMQAPARVGGQIATARSAAAAQRDKPSSVQFNKEDFKNDPLIQKALEIFKGTIVDVRA
jgi:DNA polymerase-3 subunit gamma/tau